MQNNPEAIREALRMAQSTEGQQLLKRLQQRGGLELSKAMDQAAAGDYDSAKAILSSLLQDPGTRELMKRMGGSHGPDGR